MVLPVNPSTLRVFKHLQKLDPSGYPSAGVSEPSGSVNQSKAEEFAEVQPSLFQTKEPTLAVGSRDDDTLAADDE